MTTEQIVNYITTAVASVGGVAGVISIVCAIIKTFGGNSVKARLASTKIELDNTMNSGLSTLRDVVLNSINTDIEVDISAKMDKLVQKELKEQKELNSRLAEDNNALRKSVAMVLDALAEMKVLSLEDRKALAEQAEQLSAVAPVEKEEKIVAHITLKEEEEETEEVKEVQKVVL